MPICPMQYPGNRKPWQITAYSQLNCCAKPSLHGQTQAPSAAAAVLPVRWHEQHIPFPLAASA
eukprot:6191421-Pleurochrysis_carterae.AAC.6